MRLLQVQRCSRARSPGAAATTCATLTSGRSACASTASSTIQASRSRAYATQRLLKPCTIASFPSAPVAHLVPSTPIPWPGRRQGAASECEHAPTARAAPPLAQRHRAAACAAGQAPGQSPERRQRGEARLACNGRLFITASEAAAAAAADEHGRCGLALTRHGRALPARRRRQQQHQAAAAVCAPRRARGARGAAPSKHAERPAVSVHV